MKRLWLVAILLAAPLVAQPPRNFFAWWDSPVVRNLNLTADQQKQVKDTVREYRMKLIDLRAAVEKSEAEVEELFNEDSFDQRRTSDAIERLVNARGDLTRALSLMGVRLRATLTPEQWRELQKRREEMRGRVRDRMLERGPMRKQNRTQPPPPPAQPQF